MKKFLSLVLALVMTMSLVTISAGATEFKDLTDVDEIDHKEAVELFNKIGIITGYEDGSFGPDKTITREQAAKIIAIMALGNDAASKLGAEKAPFPDVPATSQFAGYIGYCVSAGIIDGYTDGTFKPKGTLTGYQFAKMLLGVIGYGVNDEYVGSNWALNVARDGATIGLFDDATVTAGLIDRDNATQVAFDALWSPLVAWSELLGSYIMVNQMNQTLLGTLAQNIFELSIVDKTDSFGYPTHAYRQNGKVITDYYLTGDIVDTITDMSITGNNLYDDYTWEMNNNSQEVAIPVYYNGLELGEATGDALFDGRDRLRSFRINAGIAATAGVDTYAPINTMSGHTIVLVDADEDSAVDRVIVTNAYLAEVTRVTAATSTADRRITFTAYTENGRVTATADCEEFAAGDMVLVTPSLDAAAGADGAGTHDFANPLEIVAPQVVTGSVTAFYRVTNTNPNGSVLVDGTTYTYNGIYAGEDRALGFDLADDADNVNYSLSTDASYNFYLDANGYVIGAEVVDDVIGNYAYIIAKGEDAFQDHNIAKVLTSDGKIATYTVSSKSDAAAIDSTDAVPGTPNDQSAATAGTIWSYSINSSNEIVLKALSGRYAQVSNSTVANNDGLTSFTKGGSVIAYQKGAAGNETGYAYADDNTVFCYLKDDGTVAMYTGKANAPTVVAGDNKVASIAVRTVNGTPYATFVVIDGNPAATMGTNYVYVLDNFFASGTDVNGDEIWFYPVIMNGQRLNLAFDDDNVGIGVHIYSVNDALFAGLTNGGDYEVQAGVYTAGAPAANTVSASTVVAVSSSDTVIVDQATNAAQYLTGEAEVIDISDPSNIAFDANYVVGDTVVVVYEVVSGLNVAKTVYILAHNQSALLTGLHVTGVVGTVQWTAATTGNLILTGANKNACVITGADGAVLDGVLSLSEGATATATVAAAAGNRVLAAGDTIVVTNNNVTPAVTTTYTVVIG